MRYVEADQIVAQQKTCALSEIVEAAKRSPYIAAPVRHGLSATAADDSEAVYPPAFAPDLKIDR